MSRKHKGSTFFGKRQVINVQIHFRRFENRYKMKTVLILLLLPRRLPQVHPHLHRVAPHLPPHLLRALRPPLHHRLRTPNRRRKRPNASTRTTTRRRRSPTRSLRSTAAKTPTAGTWTAGNRHPQPPLRFPQPRCCPRHPRLTTTSPLRFTTPATAAITPTACNTRLSRVRPCFRRRTRDWPRPPSPNRPLECSRTLFFRFRRLPPPRLGALPRIPSNNYSRPQEPQRPYSLNPFEEE